MLCKSNIKISNFKLNDVKSYVVQIWITAVEQEGMGRDAILGSDGNGGVSGVAAGC